jgi:hypothetical protein
LYLLIYFYFISLDDVPEYYLTISAKHKGLSRRVIIQHGVDAATKVLGLVHLQVTPSQVMTMKGFDVCRPSYSQIGTGILPFSITPDAATSDHDRTAITADWGRADTYYLSGEAVNGAISTADDARMRNLKWYVAVDWMEACMKLQCMAVLMGDLMGTTRPVFTVCANFLRK